MGCGRVQDKLGLYIDGALGDRDMGEVAVHLATCAACRAELAALTTMIETARDIEEVDPPVGLRAAIAAATTQRPVYRPAVLARLREAFTPSILRWAGGLAGAAALIVIAIVSSTGPGVQTPTVARSQSPVREQARVVHTHPAPVTTAYAPVQPASSREIASPAPREHSRRIHGHPIAQRNPKPIQSAKATSKPAAVKMASTESDAEVYGVDDTTAARTITPADMPEPERVVVKTNPDLERVAIKVAASPLPREEQIAQWAKDAKDAAAMRRRSNSSGVSLINARF